VKWIKNDFFAMENIFSKTKKSFSILFPSKYEFFCTGQEIFCPGQF